VVPTAGDEAENDEGAYAAPANVRQAHGHRRQSAIYFTIWDELKRQGVGANEPWHSDTLKKAVDARLAAWADAQAEIGAPAPRTPLEDLLDEPCRLQQQEYDMLDAIEKQEGAVSPLYDSRPYSVPRPCPYPLPELVPDPKQEIPS
jgi:hypothetical protein